MSAKEICQGFFAAAAMIVFFMGTCSAENSQVQAALSTKTFQLRKAWENYVKDSGSHAFKMSGTGAEEEISGSGVLTHSDLTPVIFEKGDAFQKVAAISGNLVVNGQAMSYALSDTWYYDRAYNLLGSKSEDGEYAVASDFKMPEVARLNDKGVLYTMKTYKDSTKSTVSGNITAYFVLEPETASTALFKIVEEKKDASGRFEAKTTETIRVTPDGKLTLVSQSAMTPEGTLTIAY